MFNWSILEIYCHKMAHINAWILEIKEGYSQRIILAIFMTYSQNAQLITFETLDPNDLNFSGKMTQKILILKISHIWVEVKWTGSHKNKEKYYLQFKKVHTGLELKANWCLLPIMIELTVILFWKNGDFFFSCCRSIRMK